MITKEYDVHQIQPNLQLWGALPEDSVFFDIETTGFRADTSHVYLIGAACRVKHGWRIYQWMSESPREEAPLLRTFAAFLRPFHYVLHFNGARFDIPYLTEKYESYGLPSPFLTLRSIDLYGKMRPLKQFLGLAHMNQKALEGFLGIRREDAFDGGALIPIYRRFVLAPSPQLAHLLLLHNREDVQGMLCLTSLGAYLQLADFVPDHLQAAYTGRDDLPVSTVGNAAALRLWWQLPCFVPVPVEQSRYGVRFSVGGDMPSNQAALFLPVCQETLRYYFPDYKNYYYLPVEDQAIHKSVGVYVDPAYRKPATKATCYVRQAGSFLPQAGEWVSPALRRIPKDPLWYFAPSDGFLGDNGALEQYRCRWMQVFLAHEHTQAQGSAF